MSAITEIERLKALEAVIDRGRRTFIEVGDALREIRDSRLYLADFGTFEEYCQERWGWGRDQAGHLIRSAETMRELTSETRTRVRVDDKDEDGIDWDGTWHCPYCDHWNTRDDEEECRNCRHERYPSSPPLPTSEFQIRPLRVLPTPEVKREVWRDATETYGPSPTHNQVREVVQRKQEELALLDNTLVAGMSEQDAERMARARILSAFSDGIYRGHQLTNLSPSHLVRAFREGDFDRAKEFMGRMRAWCDEVEREMARPMHVLPKE